MSSTGIYTEHKYTRGKFPKAVRADIYSFFSIFFCYYYFVVFEESEEASQVHHRNPWTDAAQCADS